MICMPCTLRIGDVSFKTFVLRRHGSITDQLTSGSYHSITFLIALKELSAILFFRQGQTYYVMVGDLFDEEMS